MARERPYQSFMEALTPTMSFPRKYIHHGSIELMPYLVGYVVAGKGRWAHQTHNHNSLGYKRSPSAISQVFVIMIQRQAPPDYLQ